MTVADTNANNTEELDDMQVEDASDQHSQEDENPEENESQTPAARTTEQYSPREKALMNKVRAEEKQKLYKDKEKDRKENAELKRHNAELAQRLSALERQLNVNASTQPTTNSEAVAQQRQDSDLRDEIRSLREELQTSKKEAALRQYRADRIAEAREAGEDLIDSLVLGNTEEEIDIAIEVAKAEYEHTIARHESRNGGIRHTTVVRDARNRPTGVARTPRQPSSVSDNTDTVSIREIQNVLADGAGVRNGAWAQHREKFINALKSGKIRRD